MTEISAKDRRASLTTPAPILAAAPAVTVTGNLVVSLPTIGLDDGAIHRMGVLSEHLTGVVDAHGDDSTPLARPWVQVNGEAREPAALIWSNDCSWVPSFEGPDEGGTLHGTYLAPMDTYGGERGVALRLTYRNTTDQLQRVRLGWSGRWAGTALSHFRAKAIGAGIEHMHDTWTGSDVMSLAAPTPLLSLGIRGGSAVEVASSVNGRWNAVRSCNLAPHDSVVVDVFLAVAPEQDGASVGALHLRRRGFDDMLAETLTWLRARALPFSDAELHERGNRHLFFNYFFAQGDCLDTGRPVLVTSRSPHYYVSGALWSRDAFLWTYPALLLTDPARARTVLVETVASAGVRLADHALYLNGTRLYPGFELDQAVAPVLAVWRYVQATGDTRICDEPAVRAHLNGVLEALEPWWSDSLGLYATFLLATDDPTDYPYVATANALVAAALQAVAGLLEESGESSHRARADVIRSSLHEHLRITDGASTRWAWACDAAGETEDRDEPPLGLRLLSYWGVCDDNDPAYVATVEWLTTANPYHFSGPCGGAGAAHFPFPSGFDLANRLLTAPEHDPGPVQQLHALPFDHGLGCESWDPVTGEARTGAAMASMSGLLAWTAWARLAGHRHWRDPLSPRAALTDARADS